MDMGDSFTFASNFAFESSKQFKPTPQLAYVDEYIINQRICTIYKSIKNEKYKRAYALIDDTLNTLKNAKELFMDSMLVDRIMNDFFKMTFELAFQKFNAAHNRLRDLHYFIISLSN
jgi:hypothetical protein